LLSSFSSRSSPSPSPLPFPSPLRRLFQCPDVSALTPKKSENEVAIPLRSVVMKKSLVRDQKQGSGSPAPITRMSGGGRGSMGRSAGKQSSCSAGDGSSGKRNVRAFNSFYMHDFLKRATVFKTDEGRISQNRDER
jgi:hypothetical protein